MGLRTKFNLVFLAVAVIGVGLFALALTPLLRSVATDEALQSSRIMMESAAGARKYTVDQIAPLLEGDMQTTFRPQVVSAYAAKQTFAVLHAKFPDYCYREAALNPTNPEDRASDWEADIINDFRDHPAKPSRCCERDSAIGPTLVLARPLAVQPACLAVPLDRRGRAAVDARASTARRTASAGRGARSSAPRSSACRSPCRRARGCGCGPLFLSPSAGSSCVLLPGAEPAARLHRDRGRSTGSPRPPRRSAWATSTRRSTSRRLGPDREARQPPSTACAAACSEALRMLDDG